MERLWCEAIKREVIRRQAVRNVPVLTCRIFYFFEMEALFVSFLEMGQMKFYPIVQLVITTEKI